MTVTGGLRRLGALPLVALGLALLLAGCAERGTGAPAPTSAVGLPENPDALVLQVSHVGGFVRPEMLAARLPVVSVYADGRVITEGPVIAIHPGPALPNVQVVRVDPPRVRELVDAALAAGLTEEADLGRPPLADATTTRFLLHTGGATLVREAYALRETTPGADGLTPEQDAARGRLAGLLDQLTGLVPDEEATAEEFRPAAVAVVVRPWADPQDGLEHPELAWPGPPLPGDPLSAPGQTCVTAAGEDVAPVLDTARGADTATPWTAADGSRWSLTFRPLLPHEANCTDLLTG